MTIYIKKDNETYVLTYELIVEYISGLCQHSKIELDPPAVDKLANLVYSKLKEVNQIDNLEDQIVTSSIELSVENFDYQKIAVYILVSRLHRETTSDYLEVIQTLYFSYYNELHVPIISEKFYNYVKKYHEEINKMLIYDRDYVQTFFSLRTLETLYLKKNHDGKIIERPQHMYMRVAIVVTGMTDSLDVLEETYTLLSRNYYVHATPTLMNAGSKFGQLASCFLLGIEDSMEGIGECVKKSMMIGKHTGGMSINLTNLRTHGSCIKSIQNYAGGLKVVHLFDEIIRYINQSMKRSVSIAIYLEPWHGDILYFLDLKKNTGAETERARDLFLGLTINDIFMRRVEEDGIWSLMCPSVCPGLLEAYGSEFDTLYENYEKEKKYIKQIPARNLWFTIMSSQIETGVPYICFKDAINYKSNQINIGVIKSSNLCTEIMEYSSSSYYSVCNLASICLPKFVKTRGEELYFDYMELKKISSIITRNLNIVIDENCYPVPETQYSSLKDRPIGIGVQGLADVFLLFQAPFDSPLARDLNKKIFETIYFGAMEESMNLSKIYGPYESYPGSPISKGKFQFDLWNVQSGDLSGLWDWDQLREEIKKYGVRNSLTTTCMPTASTSQICGYNECLSAESEIYLPCGLSRRIRDFEKNLDVLSFGNGVLETQKCYQFLEKGKSPIVKLQLGDGTIIQCTPEHKFLTSDLKWCEARYLSGKKLIGGPRGTLDRITEDEKNFTLFHEYHLGSAEAREKALAILRILGYLSVSDIAERRIHIVFRQIYDFYLMKADLLLLNPTATIDCLKNMDGDYCLIFTNNLSELFFKFKKWTFPDFLKRAPICLVREFLGGYFGRNMEKIKLTDRLSLPTINIPEKHIEDLLFLVNRCGLVSNREENSLSFQASSFLEKIGFRFSIEKMLLLTVSTIYEKCEQSNPDLINFLLSMGCLHWFTGPFLDRKSNSLPYYVMDVTLLPTTGEEDVYDINVEKNHSFLVSGVVTHNCIEPYTSNIYNRSTASGEYYVICQNLIADLKKANIWNSQLADLIKYNAGSIQNIDGIPAKIKEIYRTVWELPQKSLIDMAADRAPFIDQSQSLNIFIQNADFPRLNSCLLHSWKRGLKTGMYYLRTKPSTAASQFGIDIKLIKDEEKKKCKIDNKDSCILCSS